MAKLHASMSVEEGRLRWPNPCPAFGGPPAADPAARFNNFITDFWTDPANKGKSRADAVAAWERIKSVPGPKTYEAYAALQPSQRSGVRSEQQKTRS